MRRIVFAVLLVAFVIGSFFVTGCGGKKEDPFKKVNQEEPTDE